MQANTRFYNGRMFVLFYLSHKKTNARGKTPLYCRVTINGKRAEFSTGIYADAGQWLTKKQSFKPSTTIYQQHNSKLNKILADLDYIKMDLERSGKPITAATIKRLFSGDKKPAYTLLAILSEYYKKAVNDGQSNSQLRRIKAFTIQLKKFLNYIKRTQIEPDELTHSFGYQFIDFLKECRRLEHNEPYKYATLKKKVQIFSDALDMGIRMGWCTLNPIKGVEVTGAKTPKQTRLTNEEIKAIHNHRFASVRLQNIADLFLLQCYTGLAYTDIMSLNPNHIILANQTQWILKNRDKSGIEALIPLFPDAKCILDKYTETNLLNEPILNLPRVSNQKYNAYLKEIAEIVGINKRLTTHAGRRTFSQRLSDRGVDGEVIMKMMGHSSPKTTFEHYVDVSIERIAGELTEKQIRGVVVS